MKTREAIEAFGSVRAVASALGITTQSVYGWGEDVPELRAFQLREILAESGAPAKGSRRKAKTDAPEKLEAEQLLELQRWAARECPDRQARVPELVAQCLDHFRAKGEPRADWPATCRNWIRNDLKFQENRNERRPQTASEAVRDLFS